MNGGAGDDTLAWNNGDGNDDMNGDDGLDRIEDNLGAADDVSQLSVVNGKVHYAPRQRAVHARRRVERGVRAQHVRRQRHPRRGPRRGRADRGRRSTPAPATTASRAATRPTRSSAAWATTRSTRAPAATRSTARTATTRSLIRDGAADLARGGAGTDSATVDFVDAVGADVEKVDRAKSGANALTLRKNAKVTRSKTGKYSARLVLTCDASALEGCKGRLSLLTAKSVKIGGVRVRPCWPAPSTTSRPARRAACTVKLPSVAKRLASKRSLKVKAQAVSKDATGAVTTRTANVTLKFPR